MAAALRRILKFRKLTEEQARLQLEQATQLLRQATAARERSHTTERHQRSILSESWLPETGNSLNAENAGTARHSQSDGPATGENAWLLEQAALEFSSLQRKRLKEIEEIETHRVEPMIERYMEQRRELRQTELLLEKQTLIENQEGDRRAQAGTDEWFLQRILADRRRSERRERLIKQADSTKEQSS